MGNKPTRADRIIRPVRIEGDLAFIPLSQNLEAVIDASDAPLVEGRNWHAVENRNVFYARACGPRGTKPRRMIPLHRLLMSPPDGLLVDHIDGNGLNCRRSNMRLATVAENTRNQRLSVANTSQRKGVTWHKRLRKWVAYIGVSGRTLHLGRFDDIEEAAAKRAEAEAKYYNDFATRNNRGCLVMSYASGCANPTQKDPGTEQREAGV
jgi:hypothetical protein